jgi:hypothetical protein
MANENYTRTDFLSFLERKSQLENDAGFVPLWIPDFLFDFQKSLVEWSIRKGRAALFEDCGLGKTPQQLVWAENVVRKENRPVLILTPLAVAAQTVREADKFGIQAQRSTDGTVHSGINVTNYERLHHFDPNDFAAVVCDESSALKHFAGARQKLVTEFMRKVKYRLLCTATASPNDYIELGTSAEALGQLGRMDMLGMFFRNDENSLHPIWWGARWRFKPHAEQQFWRAEQQFWRWVCSWARAVRKPSDMGFDDGAFKLPELITQETVVANETPLNGMLFREPARSLNEQREERRQTLQARCDEVAARVSDTGRPAVSWGHLNAETDLLEKLIKDAVQVSGLNSDDEKEEKFLAFAEGQIRVLVTKPKIGAFGLNWQHCAHMTFFPSHSFEQYYQGIRRCWRFGQTRPVVVDLITSEGEIGVLKNLKRKAVAADQMFEQLVSNMFQGMNLERISQHHTAEELPAWLS